MNIESEQSIKNIREGDWIRACVVESYAYYGKFIGKTKDGIWKLIVVGFLNDKCFGGTTVSLGSLNDSMSMVMEKDVPVKVIRRINELIWKSGYGSRIQFDLT